MSMNLHLEAVNDEGDNVSHFHSLWQTPTDVTYRIYRLNTEGKTPVERFFLQLEEYEKWVTEVTINRIHALNLMHSHETDFALSHVKEIHDWANTIIDNGFTPEFYYM